MVYAEGVRRAESLDADKVREQLLKLELRTIFGQFKVDPDGVQIAHKMVTLQWQREKKVVVWPDDLAQGKVLFPTPPWTAADLSHLVSLTVQALLLSHASRVKQSAGGSDSISW
jgi:hypothetical protein